MSANKSDLFKQINDTVLDLQQANLQSYERPLRRLGQLLAHEDLADANRSLTAGLDYEAFLVASEATGGGMVGSHRLAWPEDRVQELGMMLLLILDLCQDPGRAANFGHRYFDSSRKIIAGIHGLTRQLILPFLRDYKAYVMQGGPSRPTLIPEKSNRVFIVHGHDGEARESAARFLTQVGLEPVILHEQANRGRTIIEKVEANNDVGFAVVLLTPDDEGRRIGDEPLARRPRQNVLLELGYFIAHLGRANVCALKKGDLEIPSDFAGVVWSSMDSTGGWRVELAKELNAAGYAIDWNRVMG